MNFGVGLNIGIGGEPDSVVIAPAAPTATAATLVTDVSFTANWNVATGATDYRFDLSTNSGFSSFVTIGETSYNNLLVSGGTTNSLAISGLTAGTTYYYRVRAVNAGGTSANSETITQETPTTVTFTGTPSIFRLGWTGHPTSGDLSTLVSAGLVEVTGSGVTASYSSGYWTFSGITNANTIKIKQFAKLTYIRLSGASIAWTYTGAMPTGLTYLNLDGASIAWTYTGALPTGLTYLFLSGASIAWTWTTDSAVNGTRNISEYSLLNYRTASYVSGAELLNLLKSMATRTGSANGGLPETCRVKEYDNNGNNETDPSPKVTVINAANPIVDGNMAQQLKYWCDKVIADTGCNTLAISKA